MKTFTSIIALALAALVSAQAPPQGGPPGGPGPNDQPCPPQFQLQCCGHVISAQDAGLFKLNVDPQQNPGLAATACQPLKPTGQCAMQNYPVCCKNVQSAFSAGCIPA